MHPLPPRLQRRAIDFGTLSAKSITDYIQALISLAYAADETSHMHVEEAEDADPRSSARFSALGQVAETNVKLILQTAHDFVRRELGEAAVSQRDLHRFFKLWRFLLWHAAARARRTAARSTSRYPVDRRTTIMRSAVLAVGVVYFLRLSPAHRRALNDLLLPLTQPLSMEAELAKEADTYMQAVPETATPGVTRNAALKENVFAVTVCIQVRWERRGGGWGGTSSAGRIYLYFPALSFNRPVSVLHRQPGPKLPVPHHRW